MLTARLFSSILRALLAASLVLIALPINARAQLRPLEPTDFRAFGSGHMRVQLGGSVYWQQYASLTGTRGRLVEAGDVRASWRGGRILIELSGTLQRFFREDTIIREPVAGVTQSSVQRTRRDAGDYRVQTVLQLTGDSAPTALVLRFGTRLPTTDNRVGLERDQTDFFASLGGARSLSIFRLMAEAGVSINGTRLSNYEQSDVLIYAATIERPGALLSPFVTVVGQNDLHRRAVRGNEDLGELRAGIRVGDQRWINAAVIRGFQDSSPHWGAQLSAGVAFGRRRR